MIEPMYRVEMTPIDRTRKENGGHVTDFPSSGRVIEMYRGSHIGQFWHGQDGLPHIAVYIKDGSSNRVVDADRLDLAIHEIWEEYRKSLPCWERCKRRLYSYRAWLATIIVSVIASAISSSIVLSVDHLWSLASQDGSPTPVVQQDVDGKSQLDTD